MSVQFILTSCGFFIAITQDNYFEILELKEKTLIGQYNEYQTFIKNKNIVDVIGSFKNFVNYL